MNWKQITSDVNILNIVKGYQIELSILPVQYTARKSRVKLGKPVKQLQMRERVQVVSTILPVRP